MANKSRYLEDAILNHVLRNVSFPSPTDVYVALFTSDPGKTGTGTEVSGGGYVRQKVTFSAPSAGQVQNSADVVFPIASASWGLVTHVALMTAAVGGNRLYQGPLDTPKQIDANDQLKFALGSLKVSEV